MEFTPSQISAIERIVDLKFLSLRQQVHHSSKTNTEYHTKPEIRNVIQSNIDDIKAFLGSDPFSVQVLHHYLGKLVKFRSGDHKPHRSGGTRWKSQVTGVISSHPCFVSAGTAGIYKLSAAADFNSTPLFDQ